jgi:hypothetical protein
MLLTVVLVPHFIGAKPAALFNPNLNRFPSEKFRFGAAFCGVNCLDDADFKCHGSGTDRVTRS